MFQAVRLPEQREATLLLYRRYTVHERELVLCRRYTRTTAVVCGVLPRYLAMHTIQMIGPRNVVLVLVACTVLPRISRCTQYS